MSLFSKLRLALGGTALKMAGLTIVPRWVRSSWLDPSWERLVGDAYRANSAFLACAAALAFAFPEPPLLPYSQEGDEGEPLLTHPLRFLLRRPNPRMGEREMLATTMAYLALGGNAYWHKVRNNSGQVIRLWPYHAGQMLPVPGGDDWISHFAYDAGDGRKEDVPVEDVVHFRWPLPDPEQPWMGLPPIVAAAREVDTDNEARRYVYALLRNDAVPRLALELPEHVEVNDDSERRLKAEWRQKYGGDNRGEIGILTGGAKISRVGLNMDELAYNALSRIPEARIAAVLRVPAVLAGLSAGLERSTYSNYAEARTAFTEDTLSPLWEIFASEVDTALAPEFDDRLDMRFDLGRVKALSENTDARWKRIDTAVNRGLLTLNEGRTALGYPEVDGGDVFLWGFNTLAQPVEGLGQIVDFQAPRAFLEDEGDEKSARPAAGRKASPRRNARRLQRIRLAAIEAMADDVDDYFAALAERVAQRAEEAAKSGTVSRETKDDLPDVDALLRAEDEEALRALFRQHYAELMRASWQAWGEMLEDEAPFSLENPAVQRILARSGQNIGGITETTRSAIQEVLVVGRENGWSIDQLVEGVGDLPGLRSVVAETYQDRARTIARTELGTAQNLASVERYQETGVQRVRIFDNGFDNSHPRCKELDGTTQTLAWVNESSENVLQHPNCVRAFGPVFEE